MALFTEKQKDKIREKAEIFLDMQIGDKPKATPEEKRKKRIAMILLAIIIFVGTGLVSGVLGATLNGNLNIGGILSFGFGRGIGLTLLLFVIVAVAAFLFAFHGRDRLGVDETGKRSTTNNQGSGYLRKTEREIKDDFLITDSTSEVKDAFPIGRLLNNDRIVSIFKSGVGNRNSFTYGAPGSEKSVSWVRTLALGAAAMGHSLVMMDPKGELAEDLSYYLKEKMGYKHIYHWNLNDQMNSDAWDIVGEMKDEQAVFTLTTTIINTTTDKVNKDFFDEIEKVLLQSILLYAYEVYPEGKKTFGEAFELLRLDVDDLDSKFIELKKVNPKSRAVAIYSGFIHNKQNKSNAILGLKSRLNIFESDLIKKITGVNEIDLDMVAKEKSAVFCVFPDTNETYGCLLSSFINLLFKHIYEYANHTLNRKCDVPVEFILDELGAVPKIDDLGKYLSTARSRDIGVHMIAQNIPLMKMRYPNEEYKALMANCNYQIIFSSNDPDTSDYFVELMGEKTNESSSVRKNLSTLRVTDLTPTIMSSSGENQRKVQFANEIRTMSPQEFIIVPSGGQPVKLRKLKYAEFPESLLMKMVKIKDHIPNWRIKKDGTDVFGENIKPEEEIKANAPFIVVDGKFGPQRTDAQKEADWLAEKYALDGVTPNGLGFIIDGDREGVEIEKEVVPASELDIETETSVDEITEIPADIEPVSDNIDLAAALNNSHEAPELDDDYVLKNLIKHDEPTTDFTGTFDIKAYEEQLRSEYEAKLKRELEEKVRAEREAKIKAEREARLKAEAEAKVKAEIEAKVKAEIMAKYGLTDDDAPKNLDISPAEAPKEELIEANETPKIQATEEKNEKKSDFSDQKEKNAVYENRESAPHKRSSNLKDISLTDIMAAARSNK